MALLRAVAYGWRQEQLTEHAEEAGRLGKDLYERMAVLTEHLNDVGQALGKSVLSYNKAIGSLETRISTGGPSVQGARGLVGERDPHVGSGGTGLAQGVAL